MDISMVKGTKHIQWQFIGPSITGYPVPTKTSLLQPNKKVNLQLYCRELCNVVVGYIPITCGQSEAIYYYHFLIFIAIFVINFFIRYIHLWYISKSGNTERNWHFILSYNKGQNDITSTWQILCNSQTLLIPDSLVTFDTITAP